MIITKNDKVRMEGDVVVLKGVLGAYTNKDGVTTLQMKNSDLVIAITSSDEINILASLVANKIGIENTIARVRNPIYYEQIDILREDLRLSMTINPELTVANEIARVLIFPSASKVETFVKGRVELVEVPVRAGNPMIGVTLAEVYKKMQIKILVCAV